jgi:hypothetical protein
MAQEQGKNFGDYTVEEIISLTGQQRTAVLTGLKVDYKWHAKGHITVRAPGTKSYYNLITTNRKR